MKTFGTSLWGHVADKIVEALLSIGPLLAILIRNDFSAKKIVENRYETAAIAVTSVSALVIWHAFRSAYALSGEIVESLKSFGFTTPEQTIRSPKIKLYGIASCLTVLAMIASGMTWKTVRPKLTKEVTKRIIATASSDMIARVYFRGPHGQQSDVVYKYQPKYEEYFYEWVLTLRANTDIGEISVTVSNVRRNERPSVFSAAIKRYLEPYWKSGFTEPRPPDSYLEVFEIPHLEKDVDSKIVLRRPVIIKNPNNVIFPIDYAARDFIVNVSNQCEVEKHNYDPDKRGDFVMKRFFYMRGHDVAPIRPDPDVPNLPLAKNEMEAYAVMRYDEALGRPKIEHIDAHWKERTDWNMAQKP